MSRKPADSLSTEGEPLTTEPEGEPVAPVTTEPTEPPTGDEGGSGEPPAEPPAEGDKGEGDKGEGDKGEGDKGEGDKPVDPAVAIDAFKAGALSAIGSADAATGTLSAVAVDTVKGLARSLKGASRSVPTTFLSEFAMDAMGDKRIAEAQAAMSLIKALAETKPAKVAVDPIDAAVADMLSLAYRGTDRLALLTETDRATVAEKVAAALGSPFPAVVKPEGFALTGIVSKPRAAKPEGEPGTVAAARKGDKGLGKVPRHILAVLTALAADGSAMTHKAIADSASEIYPAADCAQGAIAAAIVSTTGVPGTTVTEITKTRKDGSIIPVKAIRLTEPVAATEPEGDEGEGDEGEGDEG